MATTRKGPPKGTGGRPPKPELRRVYHSIRIAPETDALLTHARRTGESLGVTIDRLVQEKKTMTGHEMMMTLFDLQQAEREAEYEMNAALRAYEEEHGSLDTTMEYPTEEIAALAAAQRAAISARVSLMVDMEVLIDRANESAR